MAEKIGVYFDTQNIGPLLDCEALAEKVRNKWNKACPVVKQDDHLATEAGKQLIQADIDSGEIDSVCICGSSPRVDWDIFDFGSHVLVERVNLREQCVWPFRNPDGTIPQKAEEADKLLAENALDYINMSISKLQKSDLPQPEDLEIVKRILVLGGGWTGCNAALSLAQAGYEVILVEKEQELGGYTGKLYKTFPKKSPFQQAEDTGMRELLEQITNQASISVYTGTGLEELAGQPGQYTATLKTGSGQEEIQVGSMVLATGWEPLDTKYLEPLGYGKSKNVITSMQLEEMAKNGEIRCPENGKPPANVTFILGFSELLDGIAREEEAEKKRLEEERAAAQEEQGEEEPSIEEPFEKTESYRHLYFTNELTCLNTLKQANYIREFLPEAVATILYEHMTATGIHELYYKEAQNDPGIMLSKGEVTAVETGTGGKLVVKAKDTLLGPDISLETDLVVVPTGLVPTTALDPVIQLAYRQGPAFPDLALFDGFADSNYICFPYETRRTGIYAAGTVRQPMSLAKSAADAQGAALKAIQCLESVDRGVSVHPRSGDLSYPLFNFVRCTQCKRCTEECPFGALDDDEKGTPKPNTARCRRCGTCMGACPERVISFDNYSVGQIGSMITQIKVPDDMAAEGPRILILACENDAYPALDMAAQRGWKWSPYVRIIPVRCLGSVNTIWIADAMGKGNDGCLLLGCKYGDDYQCHFIKGSELCDRRMKNIGETLDRLGVELERVRQEQVAIDDYDQIPGIIDGFVDEIMKLGPNPFKGF